MQLPEQTKQQTPPQAPPPSSPRRVIIIGLVVIALVFGGLGGWAALATLHGAVIAPGEVIVESYRQRVQHLEGGIVREILVREGDWVEQDQPLIRLEAEQVLAHRDMLRGQLDALEVRLARLLAEKDGAERITWPQRLPEGSSLPDIKEIMAGEEEIFRTKRQAKEGRITLLTAQIEQLESRIESLWAQMLSRERIISSLEEELAAKRQLLEGRFIDRGHIMELERSLAAQQASREEARGEILLAQQRVTELELQITDLKNTYAENAAVELGETRQAILDLQERLRPAEDAARRLVITAPVGGVVVNQRIHTEGGVIRGGEALMDIVPRQQRLIVSAMIPTDKISEVAQGQEASVVLSAFSPRHTPRVAGKVIYVSADRAEPAGNEQVPPHYLAYIQLDPESLRAAIQDEARLTPGMPAEVYIQTEAATVLRYILRPITESMGRALREN